MRSVTRRTSPTVKRRRVAATLRLLRERANLTVTEAARQVDHDQSWLSRIESLESNIHPNDCRALLAVYGVTGEAAEAVVDVARLARQRGWWHKPYSTAMPDWFSRFVGLESDASAIRAFHPQTVPGLLQSEDYARATIMAAATPVQPKETERQVALRMDRQALLTSDDPPQFRAVLDEGALRRTIGGRRVMREQIERLLQETEQPHIEIQVLPFDAGAHAGLNGGFVILDFAPPPAPYPGQADDRIVYVDTWQGSLYYEQPAEVASYTAVFEQIRAEALSAERSRDLLRQIGKDLTT
jgi:transcriptional regulator with XRE-family HTH domain